MISNFLAKSLVQPKRQPTKKKPSDYGMDYEDIEFKSLDGVKLKGWLIRGNSEKLIILTHPMVFTKYGFSVEDQGNFKITKLEVEFLNTIKRLNDEGYNCLIFDFRNHGESGTGNEGFSAIGLFEWQDVVGVLDYILQRDDLSSKEVGFVSHCMGANSTIIAISKANDKFKNVKCIVAVQPVSGDVFTKCFIKDKYPLFWLFYNGINKNIKKFTGYNLEDMSPRNYFKDVNKPILFVQVEKDPWTQKQDIESFYNSINAEKEILWIEGEERFSGYNYFGNHPEDMIAFLKKYM